jgi:hypothetical protein
MTHLPRFSAFAEWFHEGGHHIENGSLLLRCQAVVHRPDHPFVFEQETGVCACKRGEGVPCRAQRS